MEPHPRLRYPTAEMRILQFLSQSPKPLTQKELARETKLHTSVVSEVLNELRKLGFIRKLPGANGECWITFWGELTIQLYKQLQQNYWFSRCLPIHASVIVDKTSQQIVHTASTDLDDFLKEAIKDSRVDVKRAVRDGRNELQDDKIVMPILGENSLLNALVLSDVLWRKGMNITIQLKAFNSTEEITKEILNKNVDVTLPLIPVETITLEESSELRDLLIIPLGYADSDRVETGPVGVEVWRSKARNTYFQCSPSPQRMRTARELRKIIPGVKVEYSSNDLIPDPRQSILTARTSEVVFQRLLAKKIGAEGQELGFISPLFSIVHREYIERNPSLLKAILIANRHIMNRGYTFNKSLFRAAELGTLRLMRETPRFIDEFIDEFELFDLVKYGLPSWVYNRGATEYLKRAFTSFGLEILENGSA